MSWAGRFQARDTALCIGLDPVAERLPPGYSATGFCLEVIDATADYAACYKPNIAFFERLSETGSGGLAQVMRAVRDHGLPVLLDAKRGDFPGTARVYAETYFGGPLDCDALTVNPSLGLDAVAPFAERARELERGVFLLVRTSNAGAALFQDAMEPILVEAIHDEPVFGAVVGATDPVVGARLRAALPDTLFLVPGFGAQGGDDLAPFFTAEGRGAVVSASRSILYAGEGKPWPAWKDAIRAAARDARETIERARKR